MSTNINSQEQRYQNPSIAGIIGGVVAGSTVKSLTSVPLRPIVSQISNKMINLSRSLSEDEFIQVEKAMADTIKTSGLENKGVSIIKVTKDDAEEINNIMKKAIDSSSLRFSPNIIKKIICNKFTSAITAGKNACYTNASKKIIMPEKDLGLAFFHEAGHAMNANLSTFGNILRKCRSIQILTLPIAMIALWKTKKAPGEEPKNRLDKATTFVKNNAGKLTFAAFIPLLLEEGLASLKGNNIAKKLLSPDLVKKVVKTNTCGFSSYILRATLASLGIFLGTKVKDSIASRKLAPEDN